MTDDVGSIEGSPLGAYRRARLNPNQSVGQLEPIPSVPPTSERSGVGSVNPIVGQSSAHPVEPSAENSHSDPSSTLPNADSAPAATSNVSSSDAALVDAGAASGAPRLDVQQGDTDPASAPEPGSSAPSAAPVTNIAERRAAGSVEVPPPVKDLGAELEAEIEAALAVDTLHVPDTIATDTSESGEAHAEKPPEELLEAGQHLTGRIQSIHSDGVFLELGYRSPGIVPLRQFVSGKKPQIGQRIEVIVDRIAHDEGLIYLNLPHGLRRIAGNWESLAKGQIVDCTVNRTNKGGLEVTVSGLRGFLPSSQIDLGFVSDLAPFVGQRLRVEVVEVNARKRNLVVSRRAYLMIERKEAEEKFWQSVEVGQTYTGRVRTIKDYGAFVDLGGVDGFLHVGEMSWHRIKHPSEIVKEEQTVDVKVLSLDREKKKIGLGMKQLAQNPWTTASERFPANSTVTGKVTRIADFGAFVELEPGLEGLIHVSEIDHKRVRHASDVLKVHQTVTAQVLEVDAERKRVSLSLKALLARPEEKKVEEEPPPAEAYQRRRKGPLKGGTGAGAPRGLFGNPADYA